MGSAFTSNGVGLGTTTTTRSTMPRARAAPDALEGLVRRADDAHRVLLVTEKDLLAARRRAERAAAAHEVARRTFERANEALFFGLDVGVLATALDGEKAVEGEAVPLPPHPPLLLDGFFAATKPRVEDRDAGEERGGGGGGDKASKRQRPTMPPPPPRPRPGMPPPVPEALRGDPVALLLLCMEDRRPLHE